MVKSYSFETPYAAMQIKENAAKHLLVSMFCARTFYCFTGYNDHYVVRYEKEKPAPAKKIVLIRKGNYGIIAASYIFSDVVEETSDKE